jgi:hypothetical protein
MIIAGARVRGGRYHGGNISSVATDEYFNLVTLLLPGTGTNGAQNNTFLDSSANSYTITRNGNATQGTFSPFSQTGWSGYFDGSGDYLTTSSSSNLALGSGDFTIEMWVNPANTSSAYRALVASDAYAGTTNGWSVYQNGTNIEMYYAATGGGATPNIFTATSALVANAWQHVAISRSSGTLKCFVNGVQVASVSNSINFTGNIIYIGDNNAGNYFYNGYLSNIRIVKGTAVYTSAFTPPTAPLTAITDTSLLTCQSNRFIDNSTNAFTITVTGNTSIQAFSPFDPTAAYSTTTVGGSAYFDGSGDYLSTSTTQIIPASTTYSVEAWLYLTGDYSVYREIVTQGSSGNANRWLMYINITDGTLRVQLGATGITTSFVIPLNIWTHLAFVNNAGSYNIYANGTSIASGSSAMVPENTYLTVAAFQTGTEYFKGYVSNVRISNVARSITVPTSPYTSDSNTRFLMSATNGGITDAGSKNVLETVGNASISTTQSKFGGSSMAFDGSGDYLAGPMTPQMVFGSGDMTIECWIYPNTISGVDTMFDTRTSGSYGNESFSFQINDGVPQVWAGSFSPSNPIIAGSAAVSASTWTHIAFTRASGTNRLFVNGTSVASNSNSWNQTLVSTNQYYIGQTVGFDRAFDGYIDDFRITWGYARYTANFTAPTAAFPTQ